MKKLILFFVNFLLMYNISATNVEAQLQGQERIDSLLNELPKMKDDTLAVIHLTDLAYELYSINPEKGIKYCEKALKISNEINWLKGKSVAYSTLGIIYSFGKSNFLKGNENYFLSLKINEQLNNLNGIASNYSNIAYNYTEMSDYSNGLAFNLKALKIFEKLKDQEGIASNYANIGTVYSHQNNYSKALEYYFKAVEINNEIENHQELAFNYGNIGSIYSQLSDYNKSLEFYLKAKKINESRQNKRGLAANFVNIGIVHEMKLDFKLAQDYYQKSLNLYEDLENNSGIAYNLANFGCMFLKMSKDSIIYLSPNKDELLRNKLLNLNKAIDNLVEGIKIFDELGESNYKSHYLNYLSQAYELKGDYKNAITTFKEYKFIQDSIFAIEKQKQIANLEAKRENEIKDSQINILETQKANQQLQSYILIGGVIVLLGAFGVAFLRFREKKKLSEKLAHQNSEIEMQKNLVEIQKQNLEEKNHQIMSSISYAATIQNAILPWEENINNSFDDIFILFKPKDIVSGDSYWFKEIDDNKYFAVIDCTGHGVPGSMLTVIANSVLDEAVLTKKLINTNEILTYLNYKVTDILNQKMPNSTIRDGMEVALVKIDNEFIEFSGAGRPLFVKNGKIETFKTDKRGIAGSSLDANYNFSNIKIEKSGELNIYLSSDGFADQMNENSKKYSTKRFLETLDKISGFPLVKQKEILESEFNTHKGNREQIDDVTVIGIRIN